MTDRLTDCHNKHSNWRPSFPHLFVVPGRKEKEKEKQMERHHIDLHWAFFFERERERG
jgi:hypothetical protein